MSVNIGGPENDSSYRYKMPKLIAVVEGRGNGIRTRISNLPDIAKALKVRADYPLKFFGFELGAQSKWNEKEQACIVNGAHQAPDLQRLLGDFVAKFVLCPKCGLPETDLEAKKGNIFANCSACGFYGALATKHKLVGHILKNPPPPKKKKGGAADATAATGEKKKRRDGMPKDTSSGQNAAAAVGDDDDFDAKIDIHAAKLRDDDDVAWSVDTSSEAALRRQRDQIGGNRVLAELAVAAVTRDIGETADEFLAWYTAEPRSPEVVQAQLVELQTLYGHSAGELLSLFCDVVWDSTTLDRLPAQQLTLNYFCRDEKGQKIVLGYLERLLGVKEPSLTKLSAHFLLKLYELDVLEGDVVLAWADKGGASKYVKDKAAVKAIKEAAKRALDWLREAEAESDDEYDGEGEDDDDDAAAAGDDEIMSPSAVSSAKSSRATSPGPASPAAAAAAARPAAAPSKAAAAPAEEDIDIDDI